MRISQLLDGEKKVFLGLNIQLHADAYTWQTCNIQQGFDFASEH